MLPWVNVKKPSNKHKAIISKLSSGLNKKVSWVQPKGKISKPEKESSQLLFLIADQRLFYSRQTVRLILLLRVNFSLNTSAVWVKEFCQLKNQLISNKVMIKPENKQLKNYFNNNPPSMSSQKIKIHQMLLKNLK